MAPPHTPPWRHVATAILTSLDDGAVALVKRSARVGTFPGHWGGVSGFLEPGDASTRARAAAEVEEETGLTGLAHRAAGRPFAVDGGPGRRFVVHPHRFDVVGKPDLVLNWENDDAAWVPRSALAAVAPLVPRLADAVERASPSKRVAAGVSTLAADRDHGAMQLAAGAVDVLRGEAADRKQEAVGDADAALDSATDAAYTLAAARPAMWPLASALARVLDAARRERPVSAGDAWRAVEAAALAELNRATADAASLAGACAAVVESAVAAAPGKPIVSLSYSSSVVAGLTRAAAAALAASRPPIPVLVCESRPLLEGTRLARAAADAGAAVALCTDAAGAALVARDGAAAVLVGADAVTANAVVNKVGTSALVRAAAAAGCPAYAVAGQLKLGGGVLAAVAAGRPPPPDAGGADPDGDELLPALPPGVELDGVRLVNPYFEAVPLTLFAGVAVEAGLLAPDEVAAAAREGRVAVAAAFGLSEWA